MPPSPFSTLPQLLPQSLGVTVTPSPPLTLPCSTCLVPMVALAGVAGLFIVISALLGERLFRGARARGLPSVWRRGGELWIDADSSNKGPCSQLDGWGGWEAAPLEGKAMCPISLPTPLPAGPSEFQGPNPPHAPFLPTLSPLPPPPIGNQAAIQFHPAAPGPTSFQPLLKPLLSPFPLLCVLLCSLFPAATLVPRAGPELQPHHAWSKSLTPPGTVHWLQCTSHEV
uniref:Uncharacterized protein n=1 Tax=Pelusios castaneus TaxID=367368 RepID=A0A8C8S5C5_9SAUR